MHTINSVMFISLFLLSSSFTMNLKMPQPALETPKYQENEITILSHSHNKKTPIEVLSKDLPTRLSSIFKKIMAEQTTTEGQKTWKEFFLSFSLNFFSEIGDKSFVSIILVYNQISTIALFFIASFAEILMNFFSVYIGYQLRIHTNLKKIIQFVGMITSLLFGLSLIYELIQKEKEEVQEVEAPGDGLEIKESAEKKTVKSSVISRVFNITWIILMSELGDKSQITTILLSTEYNPVPIFLGTALAHVLGVVISLTIGYLVANRINNRVLNSIGALCFLYFGMQMGMNFFSQK